MRFEILGRRPDLQLLRLEHDAEWELPPLQELRQHERVQLEGCQQ